MKNAKKKQERVKNETGDAKMKQNSEFKRTKLKRNKRRRKRI